MESLPGFSCVASKSRICRNCQTRVESPLSGHRLSIAELEASSAGCDLCELLLRLVRESSTKQLSPSSSHDIQLHRKGTRLFIQVDGETRRGLSIFQMPSESRKPKSVVLAALVADSPSTHEDHEATLYHDNIQVSIPQLIDVGTAAHAGLLREWLQDCDENHKDCCSPPPESQVHLPTRLLDVGPKSAPCVRLLESKTLEQSHRQKPRFAALSYPWGDRTAHQHFCTTLQNYQQHKSEILLNDLPALLQEAIQLTRDIGLEYLWVDALCIIQGPGGDFNDEAERMEQVFSAAYCVIAASRARGVSDGFLGKRTHRETVMMPDQSLFLCEDIDDFQQDVIDGHLNQRGWVLQERALARRTIYFAERQTYWECGKGVRCETFTRMTNKQASFLGDSDFPRMAEKDTKGGRIVLFESLYEQYCRLKFTNDYDKPIAIAGLERRLCRAFDTDGGFGLFNIYLERSLLWQRDTADTPRLTKIEMPPGREYVPSWSWMAYQGSIKFLNLPFDGIEWAKSEYRSPWTTAPSSTTQNSRSVRDRSTSTFQVITRNFDLDPEEQTKAQSGIVWDGGTPVTGPLKCVVIGKLRSEARLPAQTHYTLVLKQIDQLGTFERVGVGCLTKDKIHFGGTPTWSVVR